MKGMKGECYGRVRGRKSNFRECARLKAESGLRAFVVLGGRVGASSRAQGVVGKFWEW